MLKRPSFPDRQWSLVFETELGWMYLVANNHGVESLRFGYPTLSALRAILATSDWAEATVLSKPAQEKSDLAEAPKWLPNLIAALREFAAGEEVDFSGFPLRLPPKTPFQQRVINACRAIPRGKTLTYGQLAVKARAPGAARAVGQVMARNCIPLLIPCHRVVGSNGLHGFSAPGGLATKQRLLDIEQQFTSLV